MDTKKKCISPFKPNPAMQTLHVLVQGDLRYLNPDDYYRKCMLYSKLKKVLKRFSVAKKETREVGMDS